MKTNFVHKYTEYKNETVAKRVQTMVNKRAELIAAGVENLHVKFTYGNRKTGALVPSVSLIPVADCHNCSACKNGCYDVRSSCWRTAVQEQRANNSAILREDPERYFAEIERRCRVLRFFRWHAGGDLVSRSYFLHVVEIARRCPWCEFLLFTKLYGVVNHFVEEGGEVPENLHVIFSDWRGVDMDNRYNFPVSSPVWKNAEGEEIERGAHTTEDSYFCGGDCSACAECGGGCWSLKKGQTILFEAH